MSSSSHVIERAEATFDDENLIANAGLALVGVLVLRLGLERLINDPTTVASVPLATGSTGQAKATTPAWKNRMHQVDPFTRSAVFTAYFSGIRSSAAAPIRSGTWYSIMNAAAASNADVAKGSACTSPTAADTVPAVCSMPKERSTPTTAQPVSRSRRRGRPLPQPASSTTSPAPGSRSPTDHRLKSSAGSDREICHSRCRAARFRSSAYCRARTRSADNATAVSPSPLTHECLSPTAGQRRRNGFGGATDWALARWSP